MVVYDFSRKGFFISRRGGAIGEIYILGRGVGM